MDQSDIAVPACRHDGWTPERKALFLDHLAAKGNVRAACARVGLSREAAYRLRRREALFARGWGASLVLAREQDGAFPIQDRVNVSTSPSGPSVIPGPAACRAS